MSSLVIIHLTPQNHVRPLVHLVHVWWYQEHVWWCPVVSMYIDRFELIDVYGQISLPLMLLKC